MIVCLIAISVTINAVDFVDTLPISGRVLYKDDEYYTVDFTHDLKVNHPGTHNLTQYSTDLVKIENCSEESL